jgi:hypothetical protein
MRKTGWCSECASRQGVGKYLEREAEAIEKRRRSWVRRTSPGKLSESPDALRERQRRNTASTSPFSRMSDATP